jgi:hypothetical protein
MEHTIDHRIAHRHQPFAMFIAHVPGLIPPAFSRSALSWSDLIGGFEQASTWA